MTGEVHRSGEGDRAAACVGVVRTGAARPDELAVSVANRGEVPRTVGDAAADVGAERVLDGPVQRGPGDRACNTHLFGSGSCGRSSDSGRRLGDRRNNRGSHHGSDRDLDGRFVHRAENSTGVESEVDDGVLRSVADALAVCLRGVDGVLRAVGGGKSKGDTERSVGVHRGGAAGGSFALDVANLDMNGAGEQCAASGVEAGEATRCEAHIDAGGGGVVSATGDGDRSTGDGHCRVTDRQAVAVGFGLDNGDSVSTGDGRRGDRSLRDGRGGHGRGDNRGHLGGDGVDEVGGGVLSGVSSGAHALCLRGVDGPFGGAVIRGHVDCRGEGTVRVHNRAAGGGLGVRGLHGNGSGSVDTWGVVEIAGALVSSSNIDAGCGGRESGAGDGDCAAASGNLGHCDGRGSSRRRRDNDGCGVDEVRDRVLAAVSGARLAALGCVDGVGGGAVVCWDRDGDGERSVGVHWSGVGADRGVSSVDGNGVPTCDACGIEVAESLSCDAQVDAGGVGGESRSGDGDSSAGSGNLGCGDAGDNDRGHYYDGCGVDEVRDRVLAAVSGARLAALGCVDGVGGGAVVCWDRDGDGERSVGVHWSGVGADRGVSSVDGNGVPTCDACGIEVAESLSCDAQVDAGGVGGESRSGDGDSSAGSGNLGCGDAGDNDRRYYNDGGHVGEVEAGILAAVGIPLAVSL